jgi:hypothetical protein
MMAEDAVKMRMRTSKSPLLHDADDFMWVWSWFI